MRGLNKKPTLLTAVLSLATLAGYAAYRLTLGGADSALEPGVEAPLAAAPATDHVHEDASAPGLADSMPEIVLNDLDGTPTALESLGGKPLLINFWATWCAPCLREIPLLKEFHASQDAVEVVGIAVDDLDDVLGFAADIEFNYPSLVGQSDAYEAMAIFRNDAQVMPFSVFIAADGAVLGRHYGELHREHLEQFRSTVEQLADGTIDRATARERMAEPL